MFIEKTKLQKIGRSALISLVGLGALFIATLIPELEVAKDPMFAGAIVSISSWLYNFGKVLLDSNLPKT